MIVIAATFNIKEGKRQEAISTMQTMAKATMQEDGCNDYTFYADLENKNKFFLFEEWVNQEALSAHFEMPHMTIFRAAMSDIAASKTEVIRYLVSESGPL